MENWSTVNLQGAAGASPTARASQCHADVTPGQQCKIPAGSSVGCQLGAHEVRSEGVLEVPAHFSMARRQEHHPTAKRFW